MENNNGNGVLLKKVAMFSMNDPLAPLGSQESGGKEIYVRYLAEELGKLGWQVDIFTRLDDIRKKTIVKVGKRVRVMRLKGGPEKYVSKTNLFDLLPEIFNNFLTFINNENPYELFHSHRWDGGGVALLARERFNKPIVHTFHSLGIKLIETRRKYLKEELEQEYFTRRINIENEIIKASDKVICLSQFEKEDLEQFYSCPPDKLSVISGGVNLKNWPLTDKKKAREYQMIKPEEFVVLFIGRFEWRKGLGTLISATELLKKEIPHLRVVIVGGKIFGHIKNKVDLKEYHRIHGMITDKNLEDVVTFTGNVENKALSNFYRSADVFVIPSYYEPFGLVTLEGMANKVPIVASKVGGLASVIQHNKNGLLAEPRNTTDLKDEIMTIYKSKELSQKLADEAYKDVSENYSWDHIAKKISHIYDEVINKKT